MDGNTPGRARVALNHVLGNTVYGVLSKAFSREHRAVYAGIRAYERIERQREANEFLLRRSIHRLEKGLIMKPRKAVFGAGYIRDTVDSYARQLDRVNTLPAGATQEEALALLRWAHDVLAEHFRIVEGDPKIDPQKERFCSLPTLQPSGVLTTPSRPYLRRERTTAEAPVRFEALYELAKRRRSVRWYQNKPVPRDLVDKSILVAAQAPSACNRQPFFFRIFDEPERVEALATLPMGTRGFADNFPMVLAIVGQLRAYFHPRDRHLIYIDGSLAAMSLMLALETVGLSSCPINWPDIPDRERDVSKLLGLDLDERVVMLMAIGYADPDGGIPYSHKKSLDELRSYNT